MSLNSRIFNDLGVGEFSVWANLNPELDPGIWAQLCRSIGSLSQGEFSAIVSHLSLRNSLKGHMRGKMGIEWSSSRGQVNRQEMPIVILGPSGIGGEYQREVGDR